MSSTLSLGYLIVERGVKSVWRRDGEYRGVDRLPTPPNLDREEPDRDPAWRSFWDAFYSRRLESDLQECRRVMAELLGAGFAVEIIECFVIPLEDLPIRHPVGKEFVKSGEKVDVIMARADFAGFDVSMPLPTFESLLQLDSEVLSGRPEFLNDFGLFANVDDAAEFARKGTKQLSPDLPYLPIAVALVQ